MSGAGKNEGVVKVEERDEKQVWKLERRGKRHYEQDVQLRENYSLLTHAETLREGAPRFECVSGE